MTTTALDRRAPAGTKTFVPFAVKATDDAARTFTGLASTWEQDLGDDVIHPGAFARTLEHWRAAKRTRPIPLIDQHAYHSVNQVLGKMTDAVETTAGLEASFEFVPDDPAAEQAYRRVKGAFITGLSIGYRPVKWDYAQKEGGAEWERIRHLREVQLLEVSLVIWPMNEGARVDAGSVKALLDAARAGALTDEQKTELRALLDLAAPDEAPAAAKGLAPDDPRRLAAEATLRAVTLARLGTPPRGPATRGAHPTRDPR